MNVDHHQPLGADQCVERGRLLLQRNRFDEAAHWFRQAIQSEPRWSFPYALLAVALSNTEGREREGVDAARRAVQEEPESAFNHAILSTTLRQLARDGQDSLLREALAAADTATGLDPDNDFAHTARGHAQLRLRQWAAAETSALKALELDPDDTTATEILSAALLNQGKDGDHTHLVRSQLSQNPESAAAHSAAGWNALRHGDHAAANQHFTEALRLSPMHEGARLGLVESYRARSFFYRWLIQFHGAVRKLSKGRETMFWIGGYIVYRVSVGYLRETAPWAATVLIAFWLTLVFGSHLFRGLSSFFILFDGFARRTLRPKEKVEGLVIGSYALLSLALFAASLFTSGPGVPFELLALGVFGAALPAAAAFTNDHHHGRWLYAAVALLCACCTGWGLLSTVLSAVWGASLPADSLATAAGGIIGGLFTFVRAFHIFYR